MKNFILLSIILISSCSLNDSSSVSVNVSDFKDEVNVERFISKLKIYSKNNFYPNIDN